MTEAVRTGFEQARRLGHNQLAIQAVVLTPVVVLAGLAAWIMLSTSTTARGQTASQPDGQTVGLAHPSETSPAPATASTEPDRAALADPAPVKGLKISSQSWRRGGLGSDALVTFTLRNDNAYAVRDIEIACAFSRQDGSHLTDRTRILGDVVVDTGSRRTIARMHIGFVNIDANKAKCVPVAASRV